MAPGLHKDYETQRVTFNQIYAKENGVNILRKNIVASRRRAGPIKQNYLAAKGYSFKDSEGVYFQSVDLFYRRYKISDDVDLGVDTGVFSFGEKDTRKYNGMRYGVFIFYDHFSFRLGENDFDDFSEIVPTIKYENNYKNHEFTLDYTRQNGLFYAYRVCPYKKRIKANHYSISDYIGLQNRSNIWVNMTANNYSNEDLETIGQFDWRFHYDTILNNKLTYNFAIDGYYTMHTKQNDCFYSPNFDDGTYLRIEPDYKVKKYFSILGMLGVGYSLNAEQFLYKYGLWLHGNPLKDLSYKIGCMKNNSARSGGYYYHECKAELEYKW